MILPLLRNYYHLHNTLAGVTEKEFAAGLSEKECYKMLGVEEKTPVLHGTEDDVFMLIAHRIYSRMSGLLKVGEMDAILLADFLWMYAPRGKQEGGIGKRDLEKIIQGFVQGITFVQSDSVSMTGNELRCVSVPDIKTLVKKLTTFIIGIRKVADSPYDLLLKAYSKKSFGKVVLLANGYALSVAQLLQIFDIYLKPLDGSTALFGAPALIVNEKMDLEFTKKGEPFLSEDMPVIMNYYKGVLQRAAVFG